MTASAIALIALTATTALGASNRAEYVSQVDQSCTASGPQLKKAGNSLIRIALKPLNLSPDLPTKVALRKLNRHGKQLSRAERRFNRIFAAMVEGVAAIAPAPGDEAAVAQWVNDLRQYVELNARGSRAAKHGKLVKALSLLDKALTALDTGGAAVQGFGISVCPTSSENPLF
jgi:hypothetical protein